MGESFYTEELFKNAHLVCTWNLLVSLQQMHIKGNIQGILENHIIWRFDGKEPQCELCHDMPT